MSTTCLSRRFVIGESRKVNSADGERTCDPSIRFILGWLGSLLAPCKAVQVRTWTISLPEYISTAVEGLRNLVYAKELVCKPLWDLTTVVGNLRLDPAQQGCHRATATTVKCPKFGTRTKAVLTASPICPRKLSESTNHSRSAQSCPRCDHMHPRSTVQEVDFAVPA